MLRDYKCSLLNNLNTLFLICTLCIFSVSNAQEVRVIDNKGTINTIRNNQVTTSATAPIDPLEGDVWFDTSTTPDTAKIFDGTNWVPIDNDFWSLTGNSGTDATTDFAGTIDAQDFVLKTNSIEALRINEDNQYVGIGIPGGAISPLHIIKNIADGIGIIRVEGTEPDVLFNDTDGGFNTFTFENNGVPKFAFGRKNTDAFYISRNNGVWNDDTFNILNNNGFIGINTSSPEAMLDIDPANNVPLRIRPSIATPTGANSGEFHVASDGLLYAYDGTRSKWLSVDRNMVGWGFNSGNTSNRYLRQFNGADSNRNGWRMIRNGTITAITVQGNLNQTYTIQIRKNGAPAAIATLSVSSAQGNHDTTINVNFNEGDNLQCYLSGNSIDYPEVLIEIAWRQ